MRSRIFKVSLNFKGLLNRMAYSPPDPVLASIQRQGRLKLEFYWVGYPGDRGAKVIKTDEHGVRWTLDVESNHWVTQRVAAGLLGVSVMTINNWVRQGKLGKLMKRRGVSVISMRVLERIAEARGIFINAR
jgi:hypothetical protein